MRDAEAQLIHDLRNTATVLRAAAAQLQEGGTAGVADQLVEIIGRRSEMVLRLLDDLSLLHEQERDDGLTAGQASQRVVLAEVCRDALDERAAPEGTRVHLDVPDRVAVVGDPVRVVRILDNLLTNAFRYGGPRVTVSARRDGSFVRLEVHDDGAGVPDDIAPSVFEPHVRGPSSDGVGGSGLGLAIVRELCTSMGGAATYRPRDGASFIVVLPAAPDTAPVDRDTVSSAAAVPAARTLPTTPPTARDGGPSPTPVGVQEPPVELVS